MKTKKETKELRLKPKEEYNLAVQELTSEQEDYLIESQLEMIRLERGLK